MTKKSDEFNYEQFWATNHPWNHILKLYISDMQQCNIDMSILFRLSRKNHDGNYETMFVVSIR